MNEQGKVLAFPVKPKTMNRQYKGAKITLTYVPKDKEWKWKVEVTHTMTFEGAAATDVKALRAAEKFIDKTKGVK